MDVSLSTGSLNTDNMVKSKPVKLGSKFDFKDSSLGAIVFVIMQYVFLALTFFVGLGLKYTLAVSVIALALLESLFAVTVFIVAKINRKDVFTCTTLNKKPNLVSSLLCVLIAVVCLYGFNGLTTFFLSFLEKIGYTGSSSSIVIPNFGMFLLYTITMAIIPAISEEMLFRGMIFNGLKDRGVKSAVIISA
ncbi:MAG: CPBP family intramembrane glutamic endopeptidase, partial [Clostridia bacterium]